MATIEQKAIAYDKAIDKIKYAMEHGLQPVLNKEDLLDIFPELAESDDEKIISAIRKAIKAKVENLGNGVTRTACLAWLEKQGNTNIFDVPKISIKNAVEVTSRMQYIDDDIKPIAEFIMDYANWDLNKDKWNQPTLTVPLFRVLDALIQKGKPYCECNQNIEKQGEQNHCMIQWKGDNLKEVIDFTGKDKNFEKWFKSFEEYEKYVQEHDGIFKLFNADGSHYEVPVGAWIVKTPDGYNVASKAIFRQKSVDTPKFKVGDWVIDKQGIVHQVANVVKMVANHTYGYDIVGGGYFNDNVEGVRLWNISDAKNGDVLVDNLGNVCIYQEPSTKLMYHSHCYGNHKFFIPMAGSHEIVGSYPATKEQRDQLEKSMADAGYAFDFEKKELKEIEYEPNKCEGCNNVKGCIACVDGSEWAHIEEQKPTEWNEGDESNFQGIIDELKANKHHAPDSDLPTYDRFLSWFKSLKGRYVWKPSNEQTDAL